MSDADVVRLTDLADPQFSPEVAALREGLATLADGVSFDPDALRAQAATELGLADFGDETYAAPLAVLAGAIDRSPLVAPVGRFMLHTQLVQLLKNRLLLADLLARHPEIRGDPDRAPDRHRRPAAHGHDPSAQPDGRRSGAALAALLGEPRADPRSRPSRAPSPTRASTALRARASQFIDQAMPHFTRMHEMTTWHVHEEIQLLAIDCSTMFFETLALDARVARLLPRARPDPALPLPADGPAGAAVPARRPTRWVLKSPQHLEQFGPLATVFPDATFVVTHRDPVAVIDVDGDHGRLHRAHA